MHLAKLTNTTKSKYLALFATVLVFVTLSAAPWKTARAESEPTEVKFEHEFNLDGCRATFNAKVTFNIEGRSYKNILVTSPNFFVYRKVNGVDLTRTNQALDGNEIDASVLFVNRQPDEPGFEKYLLSNLRISTPVDPNVFLENATGRLSGRWTDTTLIFKENMTLLDWASVDLNQYEGFDHIAAFLLREYMILENGYVYIPEAESLCQTPHPLQTLEDAYFVP